MRARAGLLALLLLGTGCATAPVSHNPFPSGPNPPATGETTPTLRIRVAIAVRQASIRLTAPESFVLSGFPMEGTPVVEKGEERYREAVLTADKLYGREALIEPLGEGQIGVNGKSYRGSLKIIGDGAGTLTAINELSLEDYVMGVLAGEIPRNWPLESLKAQAIAARTFAVLKRSQARGAGEPYDLENTALFQMYRGSDLVNDQIQQAVSQTAGEILTYDSKPIQAFFHSNCGGRTCGAKEVWSQDKPYLQSVPCTFGNNGAHFRWQAEISSADLARKLRAAGWKVSDVVGLKALSRDESNRIRELAVMDGDGAWKRIKGTAFRMAVGPDLIRSTRFDAVLKGTKVLFNGKGWGHGVGLCQEGACGMALKGYNAFEILRHYYQGVLIEKMKGGS